jgi:plasmid stabilization system protein ParE
MRVHYTAEAQAELNEILSHIHADNPEAAVVVGTSIAAAVSRLHSFPNIGAATDEPEIRVITARPIATWSSTVVTRIRLSSATSATRLASDRDYQGAWAGFDRGWLRPRAPVGLPAFGGTMAIITDYEAIARRLQEIRPVPAEGDELKQWRGLAEETARVYVENRRTGPIADILRNRARQIMRRHGSG